MPKNKEPPELVPNSFKHVVGMKEMYAKSGAFKLRTLQVTRENKLDGFGFTLRQGDGWGKTDGVFISRVQFGSIFDVCSLVSVGDEVVKINDTEVNTVNAGEAIKSLYTTMNATIAIKITVPFAKKRAGMKGRRIVEPPVSRLEDYKILNMRIPQKERHVYVEQQDEENAEASPAKEE